MGVGRRGVRGGEGAERGEVNVRLLPCGRFAGELVANNSFIWENRLFGRSGMRNRRAGEFYFSGYCVCPVFIVDSM